VVNARGIERWYRRRWPIFPGGGPVFSAFPARLRELVFPPALNRRMFHAENATRLPSALRLRLEESSSKSETAEKSQDCFRIARAPVRGLRPQTRSITLAQRRIGNTSTRSSLRSLRALRELVFPPGLIRRMSHAEARSSQRFIRKSDRSSEVAAELTAVARVMPATRIEAAMHAAQIEAAATHQPLLPSSGPPRPMVPCDRARRARLQHSREGPAVEFACGGRLRALPGRAARRLGDCQRFRRLCPLRPRHPLSRAHAAPARGRDHFVRNRGISNRDRSHPCPRQCARIRRFVRRTVLDVAGSSLLLRRAPEVAAELGAVARVMPVARIEEPRFDL